MAGKMEGGDPVIKLILVMLVSDTGMTVNDNSHS